MNTYERKASEQKANEQLLRDAFRTMDPHAAQEIREAYYKAIEGLMTLAQSIEAVDAKNPGPASDALIGEHLIACVAMDTMKCSQLGGIL